MKTELGKTSKRSKVTKDNTNYKLLHKIAKRALYYASQMIFQANHRKDKSKGDPKIGGHPSACASYLHIATALHLKVRQGHDCFAIKPHASPMDHTYHYMMDLLLHPDFTRFDKELSKVAMMGLRKFSQEGEPVFQSYHSAYDADHFNFLPSGTVGIPPVQLGYLAHAYRMAEDSHLAVPKKAHFWAVMGDSEYREGSLQEALPDFSERELGNLTWIVDYNRQSLDGHRITNKDIMNGTDNERIARTAIASGWEVIQVRHGQKRKKIFALSGGPYLQTYLEDQLEDYEFQTLLLTSDMDAVRKQMLSDEPKLKEVLSQIKDEELYQALHDLGGHDIQALAEAFEQSKQDTRRPTLIIAHTIKGWGLPQAAQQGNHNAIPSKKEMDLLRESFAISEEDLFGFYDESSEEAKFLKQRGDELYQQIQEQEKIKQKNIKHFTQVFAEDGDFTDTLDINLKMASYPHTQWMLGQLTAKLNRIANTPKDESKLKEKQKALTDAEKSFKTTAELIVSMAPDVGTSTNLNPTMDGQIYDPDVVEDFEKKFDVKDNKLPDLVPNEDKAHKFIRFEIEESNSMSCVGSYGRMRDMLGIPFIPLMTIYDFFVKRALDQHFYNLYWKSSFILVGTPSGVSLSPEGAQHGWKSDFQIPNQITWEPFFCQELDWILIDAIRRHINFDNEGRTGVNIRAVTRGAEQKDLMRLLKTQKRFKDPQYDSYILAPKGKAVEAGIDTSGVDESSIPTISEEEIYATLKHEVLAGAYFLINYEGYTGYEPGDNAVNIFSMGSLTTEAIKASSELLEKGIYANVIVVTSSDLLIGNLAHENDYDYIKNQLGIDTRLHLQPSDFHSSAEISSISGRKIPVVSVHDGEPGLLDNIGSVLGVKHISLAVRKHSKCGRPQDVYKYHDIDSDAVIDACGKALSETALESVQISSRLLQDVANSSPFTVQHWKELWPDKK